MRIWLIIGLTVAVAAAAGCATVTQTPSENQASVKAVTELDLRQMADDWNLMWLVDRQSRMTRWHTR